MATKLQKAFNNFIKQWENAFYIQEKLTPKENTSSSKSPASIEKQWYKCL